MSLNFAGQNLQGQCFRGHQLVGADFRGADIRSADFTNAQLSGSDFRGARSGLSPARRLLLIGALLLLLGFAGAAASVASVIAVKLWHGDYIKLHSVLPGLVTAFIIPLFLLGLLRFGLTAKLTAGAAGITVCLVVGQAVLWLTLGWNGLDIGQETAWRFAGAAAWAISAVVFGAMAESIGAMVIRARLWIFMPAWLVGLGLGLIGSWGLGQTSKSVGTKIGGTTGVGGQLHTWPFMALIALGLGALGHYVGRSTQQEIPKFAVIRNLAIFFSTIGGTQFYRANLSNANFQQAQLPHSNFAKAQLERTNFHLAQKLGQSLWQDTILQQPVIRQLLMTHQLNPTHNYRGCDLQGAYLVGALLADGDFQDGNLQRATLRSAQIDRANLTRIQALGTDFTDCYLTAACLESWNIDQTTQLTGVRSDYVYLLNHQQERYPAFGNFQPGEFTKLFAKILDTIDLIIRDGADWSAISNALQQLRVQQGDQPLTVRSVENKGDGVVVVKVEVSAQQDKAQVYAAFQQNYQTALAALQAQHHAELQAKDAQINLYRQHQNDLKELAQLLVGHNDRPSIPNTSKYIVLKLGAGNLSQGYPVTLQIGDEGALPISESVGQLPAAPELQIAYQEWHSAYQRNLNANYRIQIPATQITHISHHEYWQNCVRKAEILHDRLNQWLNHATFRPLKERLLEQLQIEASIRFLLQTEDSALWRLPWHQWDWFDRYPHAEFALSTATYQTPQTTVTKHLPNQPVRILAILGDRTGIDVEHDRAILSQLPHAAVTFLVEPSREELNDHLWAQPWDILCFAGHSHSGEAVGYLQINAHDRLPILELRHGLRKAISQGLQLAIFNSCDGLGLAANLADLHLPQMIVMREPVPDRVAQEFLKHFLATFSSGATLYASVREAREKLQGIEHRYVCASWLPVIYQNPASQPPTWGQF
jgi:uncharacterized protein YjbI with pentapeptide repeats